MDKHNEKLIVTGSFVQRVKYEKSIKTSVPQRNGGRKKNNERSVLREKNKRTTINKQKASVRQMILGNFNTESYTCTLTFADDAPNLDEANKQFKIFADKMRARFKGQDLKYLAVPEFHKSGSIHFHMIANVRLAEKEVAKLWRYGKQIKIKKVRSIENLQSVAHYFVKDFEDPRIESRTPYRKSSNLATPQTIKSPDAIQAVIDLYQLNNRNAVSMYEYETIFHGKAKVQAFINDDI